MTPPCPFCSPDPARVFLASAYVLGLWDAFPVRPGHAHGGTRRHVPDWLAADETERQALVAAIPLALEAIRARHPFDGFNFGVNVGAAAGQTVAHLHLHVIPRTRGDVPDPRGGIRWVIPDLARYGDPRP